MKIQIDQASRVLDSHNLAAITSWVVDQAAAIQQIPAPTFQERQRAEYVAERFRELELDDIDIDMVNNVYGRLAGRESALPSVMVVAHTDTVFGPDTNLELRREGHVLHGPGIGDNSLGVAGMLGVASTLRTLGIQPKRDLWFVATSCEEGLGDLKGMRRAFGRLQNRLGAVVNIEGLAFGHVYHAGIAVKRLHIVARTAGGHSWLHFGRPSAIHALMQLGAKIAALKPPHQPRTTFNIGMIDGGVSINTIAATASLWLDLRSEDMTALAALESDVQQLIDAATTPEITFGVQVVGERPAGRIPSDHPLVTAAVEALTTVGVKAALETGSTDGNVALAAGCPAVTIGVTRGGNAHRLDEFAEIGPIRSGMQQLITLVLASSESG